MLPRWREARLDVLRLGSGWLDADTGAVHRGGRRLALTAIEQDLLGFLARRAPEPVDKNTLLAEVWGYSARVASHTVKTTVSRVRRKLRDDGDVLLTVRGKGYALRTGDGPGPPSGSVVLALLEVHGPPDGTAMDRHLARLDRALDRAGGDAGFAFLDAPLHLGLAFEHGDAAVAWSARALDALPADLPGLVGVVGAPGTDPPHYAGHARDRLLEVCREARWGEIRCAPDVDLGPQGTDLLASRGTRIAPQSRTSSPVARARRPVRRDAAPVSLPSLPGWHTPWFGRVEETARLSSLLQGDQRVVTLLGPGGVGKTRLARRAVERGEAVWVDVTGALNARSVAAALADALGLDPLTPVDHVGRVLAATEGLVVLDGAEGAHDAVRAQLERWLEVAPDARFLVTSQVALDAPWEFRVRLGPLEPESARALFRARAEAVTGGPVADDAVLAELVERLDFLPLALELAAGQVAEYGVDGVLDRLDARFGLLREDGTRHGALERVFGRTWERLDPDARSAAAWCSCFAGPFSAAEVQALVTHLDAPGDALDALVRNCVLEAPGPGSLRMLESVRQYARGQLQESGEEAEARLAHARVILDWVSQARGETTGSWRARVGQREQDVLLAIDGALDGAPELAVVGLEALEQLQVARWVTPAFLDAARATVVRTRSADPRLHARALRVTGQARVQIGEWRAARSDLEDAASIARSVGDRATELRALEHVVMVRHRWGTTAYSEAVLALLPDLERVVEPEVFADIALRAICPGAMSEEMVDGLLARATEIQDRHGGEDLGARLHAARARVALGRRDYLGMLTWAAPARERCLVMGRRVQASTCAAIAGRGREALGDFEGARAMYVLATEEGRAVGVPAFVGEVGLARCDARNGDVAAARLRLSEHAASASTHPAHRVIAIAWLGLLDEIDGQPLAAVGRYLEAQGIAGGPIERAVLAALPAGALADAGKSAEARRMLAQVDREPAYADPTGDACLLLRAADARIALAEDGPDARASLEAVRQACRSSPHCEVSPLWAIGQRLDALVGASEV